MPNLLSARFSVRIIGLLTVAILGAVGCSNEPPKAVIKGTVTYKGQPLPSGMLKFVGTKGSSIAQIKSDGTFTLTDVIIPDEVKVAVERPMRASAKVHEGSVPLDLPEKYRDPNASGLQYSITAATTEINIEIK